MACEEKQRLGVEYDAATSRFAAAVTELQRKMGTSSKSEFERLSRAADEAQVRSEQARLAVAFPVVCLGGRQERCKPILEILWSPISMVSSIR